MYDADLQLMISRISDAAIGSSLAHLGFEPDGLGGYVREYAEYVELSIDYRKDRIPAGGSNVNLPVDATLRGGEQFNPGEIFSYWHDTIRALFETFRDIPDPAEYEHYLESLLGAMGQMSNGATTESHYQGANVDLADMETADDYLTLWTGATASAFKENYSSKFPLVHAGQYHVLRMVYVCLLAEQGLWRQVRADVTAIADGSLIPMEAARPQTGSLTWSRVLKAVGVVAGIVAPFVGGAVATVVGAVRTGAGVLSSFAVSDPTTERDAEVGGGHPNDVYAAMADVVDRLRLDIERSERDLAAQLEAVLDHMVSTPESFYLQRPGTLIGAVDPTEVYSPHDEISLDTATMMKVGKIWLPHVAEIVHDAATGVEAGIDQRIFTRDSGIGMGTFGPYTSWASLARHLAHLMEHGVGYAV